MRRRSHRRSEPHRHCLARRLVQVGARVDAQLARARVSVQPLRHVHLHPRRLAEAVRRASLCDGPARPISRALTARHRGRALRHERRWRAVSRSRRSRRLLLRHRRQPSRACVLCTPAQQDR
eukprot:3627257-Pleurochrysis_carterae.AAC.1